MVTAVDVPTPLVFTGKLVLDDPAGTATLGGTLATDGLLLASATVAPIVVFNVTVPVEGFPPTTLCGFKTSEVTLGADDCSEPKLAEGSTAAYFR